MAIVRVPEWVRTIQIVRIPERAHKEVVYMFAGAEDRIINVKTAIVCAKHTCKLLACNMHFPSDLGRTDRTVLAFLRVGEADVSRRL